MISHSPSTRAETSIGVAAGVYLRAFSRTLTSAWPTSVVSRGTSGSESGRLRAKLAAGQASLELSERGADDLLHRLPLLADVDRAGFEPRHVEEVADEPVQALGLVVDRLHAARAGSRADSDLGAPKQRARGPGNRGQRRAQVVRHGRQQRAPGPFGLRLQHGHLRLGGEVRPLDREGDLARERLQEVQPLGVEHRPSPTDADDAHGAAGHEEREVERGAAGERRGAEACPLGVVEAHWATESSFGSRANAAFPENATFSFPSRCGRKIATWPSKTSARWRPATRTTSYVSAGAGARAADRVQRRRPPLLRPRGLGLVPHARREARRSRAPQRASRRTSGRTGCRRPRT